MSINKTTTFHQFDPEIYPSKLWVVCGFTESAIKERFAYIKGDEVDFEDIDKHNAEAMLVIEKKTRDVGILIIFRNKSLMSVKTIAHEASHATKMIFERIGADVAPHEPFEYLLGWIADCCDQVRKNKFK